MAGLERLDMKFLAGMPDLHSVEYCFGCHGRKKRATLGSIRCGKLCGLYTWFCMMGDGLVVLLVFANC